jgi:hypothetical protein
MANGYTWKGPGFPSDPSRPNNSIVFDFGVAVKAKYDRIKHIVLKNPATNFRFAGARASPVNNGDQRANTHRSAAFAYSGHVL